MGKSRLLHEIRQRIGNGRAIVLQAAAPLTASRLHSFRLSTWCVGHSVLAWANQKVKSRKSWKWD